MTIDWIDDALDLHAAEASARAAAVDALTVWQDAKRAWEAAYPEPPVRWGTHREAAPRQGRRSAALAPEAHRLDCARGRVRQLVCRMAAEQDRARRAT